MRDVNMAFHAYLEMTQQPAQQLQLKMMASTDPGFLADCLAQHVTFEYTEKMKLLSQLSPGKRLRSMRIYTISIASPKEKKR